ncbi:MAG: hypothetical protein GTO02_05235 [Candidatus Dadabacteria bacterium]|nr:hypothetical protein [Candidatus Dadabacteria bacterium]
MSLKTFNTNRYFSIIGSLGFKGTKDLLKERICSMDYYYVLEKKIENSLIVDIKGNYEIGRLSEVDIINLKKQLKLLDQLSRREILARLVFYSNGFKNCYVAKNDSGEIAYIQWLVFPYENMLIQKKYSRLFYPLRRNQIMIENAFTFPKFRGRGLLPYVTLELLQIARKHGCAKAISYIRKDKIAALNEFMKIGFRIRKIVKEYKILGYKRRNL